MSSISSISGTRFILTCKICQPRPNRRQRRRPRQRPTQTPPPLRLRAACKALIIIMDTEGGSKSVISTDSASRHDGAAICATKRLDQSEPDHRGRDRQRFQEPNRRRDAAIRRQWPDAGYRRRFRQRRQRRPGRAHGEGTIATQAFFQNLQSLGVDPQQFHQDFLAAVQDAQSGNNVDASSPFKTFPQARSLTRPLEPVPRVSTTLADIFQQCSRRRRRSVDR